MTISLAILFGENSDVLDKPVRPLGLYRCLSGYNFVDLYNDMLSLHSLQLVVAMASEVDSRKHHVPHR
jgi:hypothetical protein